MSEPAAAPPPSPEPPAPVPGELQFDKVEPKLPSAGRTLCVTCSQPLTGTYFLLQAQQICKACHTAIATAQAWKPGFKEFMKAVLLGLIAAVAGSLIYFIPLWFFKLEIGFVAIIVGAIVGIAVRRGSGGRGGLRFQLLAVFLTYSCIVVTYIPVALKEMSSSKAEVASKLKVEAKDPAAPAPAVEPAPVKVQPLGCGGVLLGLVMLFGLALALPILAGFQNFLGWLIIGFALYEAWKINRRGTVRLSGPFQLAGGVPPLA